VDQRWQRRIGYLLALFGVVVTVHLGRVLATRATLSDAGLRVRGTPLIPWEAITDVRADASARSGRVELAYSSGGRTKVLRLDEYVHKALPAIVAAIRETERALTLALGLFHRENSIENAELVAMAYGELGQFQQAAAYQQSAIDALASVGYQYGGYELIERLQAKLTRYRDKRAYRMP